MCRISFITIHENVWLDFSLRYCHLLCSFVFYVRDVQTHAATHACKRTHLIQAKIRLSQDAMLHVIFGILSVFSRRFLWCVCVASLRFGDMRGDILWFFHPHSAFGFYSFGLCIHVLRKYVKADLKRTIVIAHTLDWTEREQTFE